MHRVLDKLDAVIDISLRPRDSIPFFIKKIFVAHPNPQILYFCLFQEAKVPVKEYAYDEKKVANVQSHLVHSFFLVF